MPTVSAELHSGKGPWTQIGCVNDNMQKNHGTRGFRGNHDWAKSYKLECLDCGHIYGANGCDIHLRKCPECQGAKKGIPW